MNTQFSLASRERNQRRGLKYYFENWPKLPGEAADFSSKLKKIFRKISSRFSTLAQRKFLRLFAHRCNIFHIAKNVRKSPNFPQILLRYGQILQPKVKNLNFLLR